MERYMSFFIEHWMLSAAFVGIVILILINEWRNRTFGMKGISPQQLVDLLNHAEGVVVDIRPQPRFELGHILGAISIPEESLQKSLKALNKYKNKPVILVCSLGGNSAKVGRLLMNYGFTQIYYLSGGMDSWNAQGMPLIKK